ncbi:MAG: ABC transporter substrate-binding protein [Deferrisomatales bacterium]|nr:ABC transporter substrate-binding protein [Deferrisomatales bacterium]
MKKIAALLSCVLSLALGTASAADPVKVGILEVLSGPLGVIGKGSVEAARMAVEDFGPVLGGNVELVIKDHAYNPGLANERAKEMYANDGVDVIVGCPNSAAALAVSDQAERHKRLFMASDAGTTDLIAKNRYTFKWNYNDYMLATTAGRWATKNLGKKWYTITADYAWGHDLLKYFTAAIQDEGGAVVGNDNVAQGTADFSAYILKARRAKPEVVALLNVGRDAANSTKAMVEYGLREEVKAVHALLFELDIKGAGIETFTGNYTAASWNWQVDNPGAREFADRFLQRTGERPHFMAAAVYSAVWQYLDAVKRAGSKETEEVIRALEGHTFRDFFANPGHIRKEDHLQTGKAYLLRVKQPDQVKGQEDFFEIVGTLPPEVAHPPVGYFGRSLY